MHIFKEIMGISPYAYVMKIRMERAADFLALSDKTVAEIANMVGFKDSLYFSTPFARTTGKSPSEWRQLR
jgi:AraC-like DNA-binding protein